MPCTGFIRQGFHCLLAPLLSFGRWCLEESFSSFYVLVLRVPYDGFACLCCPRSAQSSSAATVFGTRPMLRAVPPSMYTNSNNAKQHARIKSSIEQSGKRAHEQR